MINGAKYNFYQVHWHSPSENTVDGKSFPMEAHFVHQLDDKDQGGTGTLVGTYHRLAVIGLLYELGTDSECNTFLDYFWDTFPERKGNAAYEGAALDFNNKLAAALAGGYYHWYGSLTTPPCTEGVNWNLLKTTQKVCQRQVDKLKTALYGTDFNNRVPMPLNHRVVTFSNNMALASGAEVPYGNPWKYANDGDTEANAAKQAQTWGGLCSTGREQSPINIVTSAVADTCASTESTVMESSYLTLETHYTAALTYAKHTGYAFQLFETSPDTHGLDAVDDVKLMAEGQPKGHAMINGAKYNFYQVHWHAPSENTVDGQSFPMEAHFVHQLDDPGLSGTYHRLAVIGLLYELHPQDVCNPFLDYFWNTFPDQKGTAAYAGEALDFNEKLNQDTLAEGYYHWYGSLTTPPCTEGVSWNLIKVTQKVCQAQIDKLRTALGNTQGGINFNNRVTQPLNHRVVSKRTCAASTMQKEAEKWVYANAGETEANAEAQKHTWGGVCVTGREQSPIDVVTSAVVTGDAPPAIETRISAALKYVKHTGYALQLFETSPSTHGLTQDGEVHVMAEGQPKGYSIINGAKYNFYQVHWHSPSENTVDGQSFPLEAHFVHQLDDPALVGTYHRLAVIGLLYELGECNTFLDYFWDTFPEKKGTAAYAGEALDFNEKLAAALAQGYYHWYGSLTTPPCTEGVSWNLLKVRQTVCQRQIDVMTTALAETQYGIAFNNRVTMPLNHRVVILNGKLEPEPTTEVQATAGPTKKPLPKCSEISDPFQPCEPDETVESGAVAMMLAVLGLVHIA
jgi:carbonic anhydrase